MADNFPVFSARYIRIAPDLKMLAVIAVYDRRDAIVGTDLQEGRRQNCSFSRDVDRVGADVSPVSSSMIETLRPFGVFHV